MKRKMKYLSDCELRMMFLAWSVEAPISQEVLENELKRLGWDHGLVTASLESLLSKGLLSQHWLGHGDTQTEFYMPRVTEQDYWRDTGCVSKDVPSQVGHSLLGTSGSLRNFPFLL